MAKYLFGPVFSRRLGISLGVDLVPHKVCSLNCIYCEAKATSNLTLQRKEYVSFSKIIAELTEFLKTNPPLDFITFSGAGEPLLNNKISEIIAFLKTNFPQYKLALITNSTLLSDENIRNEIKNIDLLLPSLDAVSSDVFKKINRPNCQLEITKIIDGLIEFRKIFRGKIWLEIFLIEGLNDSENELKLLKNAIQKIKPDEIQLNSLDRPGTLSWVKPLSIEKLENIVAFFKPLSVGIIGKNKKIAKLSNSQNNVKSQILQTIKRRPCTNTELAKMCGISTVEIDKNLEKLISENKISTQKQERGIFYCAKN
ncbi:MAG: radical SAM protein [Candidatus Cloacimonetes bacterium]|jgi:wyosine [tRNA(Phe)-imidazoG37] synthetase (radical SAM superfamily)|nr:radical SAM protein [Candidatus Cloacimonadota bacterium]MBT6994342.1 radical SAM protein [Candidatus Cloacimonadota bacterium]MBT7469296.1 radical SAM protein [Candidatus Cloacimonadota bacterium]